MTLVKCTAWGVTGVFDPRGNVLFKAPQASGTVFFTLPQLQRAIAFPRLGTAFDIVVVVSGCVWVLLAAAPGLSFRLFAAVGAADLPQGQDEETGEQAQS